MPVPVVGDEKRALINEGAALLKQYLRWMIILFARPIKCILDISDQREITC